MIVAPTTLAAEIVAAHTAAIGAARDALAHARRAGDLLIEARATVPHGAWLDWLTVQCPDVSARTAQRYMAIATHWDEIADTTRVSHLSVRGALALLSGESRADELTDAAPGASLAGDLLEFRQRAEAAEAERAADEADVAILRRALDAPQLSAVEAHAICERATAIERRATERRVRALYAIGELLIEGEAWGWVDWMRALLAHPEAIPAFVEICETRIAELAA